MRPVALSLALYMWPGCLFCFVIVLCLWSGLLLVGCFRLFLLLFFPKVPSVPAVPSVPFRAVSSVRSLVRAQSSPQCQSMTPPAYNFRSDFVSRRARCAELADVFENTLKIFITISPTKSRIHEPGLIHEMEADMKLRNFMPSQSKPSQSIPA